MSEISQIFINIMNQLNLLLIEMEIQNLPEKNLLRWFIDRLDNTFVFFDTETSGLKREQNNQLTQVAAIATKLNPKDLKFDEVGRF